jgi:hypothetical protein
MAGGDMEYIRNYYGVPARRGVRIVFDGKEAVIVGASGPHLKVKIDGEKRAVPIHPTWKVEYLSDKAD